MTPPRAQKSRPLPGRPVIVLSLILAFLFPIQVVPSAEHPRPGLDGQLSAKQGEVIWLEISVPQDVVTVTGTFLKRTIPFFKLSNTRRAGLIGIDMEDPVGEQELSIHLKHPQHSQHRSFTVLVLKEAYSVQKLTLPKNKVDLDSQTLKRVRLEQKEMRGAFHHVEPQPLWDGPFLEPVKGTVTGRFGSRRIINGHPRRPHSGEDIAAPKGTPVLAINRGKVVLTADHFFSGKGVVLDHGLGLFSMYFHLSAIDVQEGQMIQKGESLGKVGSSGRATGPHLHWGIRLNGSRVNPYELTNLPLNN